MVLTSNIQVRRMHIGARTLAWCYEWQSVYAYGTSINVHVWNRAMVADCEPLWVKSGTTRRYPCLDKTSE